MGGRGSGRVWGVGGGARGVGGALGSAEGYGGCIAGGGWGGVVVGGGVVSNGVLKAVVLRWGVGVFGLSMHWYPVWGCVGGVVGMDLCVFFILGFSFFWFFYLFTIFVFGLSGTYFVFCFFDGFLRIGWGSVRGLVRFFLEVMFGV